MGHLVQEDRDSYSLDSYVKEIWNDAYKEKFWKKYDRYEDASEEDKTDYACRDIIYTRRLFGTLMRKGIGTRIPVELCDHVHRLQASLLRTEIWGVRVDKDYLVNLGTELRGRLESLDPKMRGLVADEIYLIELDLWEKEIAKYKTDARRKTVPKPVFNFSSSKQLVELLYSRLRLPTKRNSKTKALSTDYDALNDLRLLHPVVDVIQEYREVAKVYSSYIEGTLDRMDNGRIYPSFRVNGTATGRISHSNPNLGQLPKQGGIRGIYVPDNGNVIISADYSQLEVCLEANLTQDEALRRIFVEGLSKHDITAEALKIDRHAAKTLNFALQYWASHYKVAQLLGVSEAEGKRIWENYWKLYEGPKRLKAATDKMVDTGVPIQTLYGRMRRFAPGKRPVWSGDYRQAYNFLIQGTGADITSEAFYLVSERLCKSGDGRGLFTVHDEILIEVKEERAAYWEKEMLDTMVQVGYRIGLKIPLKAESSGPMARWED
jgi:DNA polymerase-1